MANYQDRLMLPWTPEGKERRRFSTILLVLFALLLVFSLWIPFITLPEKDRETLEKLPPQLARFVEKKVLPKPQPIKKEGQKKEEPKKEKKPEKKPEPPVKKEPEKPIKISKPKPQIVPKTPELKQEVKAAREAAKKTGLLALQDDLASLRTTVDVSVLSKSLAPRKAQTLAAKVSGPVAGQVMAKSAGIKTDGLSAPAETVSLQSRKGVELEETIDEKALAKAEAEAALRVNQRSEESILLVMERTKEAFYKLYIRELRKDPFLSGRLVLELVIEPSGEVSSCKIVSSELNNPALERKIVNRMLLADFGAENVVRMRHKISNNFQPN